MNPSLAYKHSPGSTPGVLFLPGFHSTMQGNKARYLETICQQGGHQFTRFDYSGHGDSPGRFEEGSIHRWRDDALSILDTVCVGPQVLVGSSMGGWIATLLTQLRPDRIHALIGIATAADFTSELLAPALSAEQHQALQQGRTIELANHYENIEPHRIKQDLLDSGLDCAILHQNLPIACPVRLLHGTADSDVPWLFSQRLLDAIDSEDAQLTLVKGCDHRFSTTAQLRIIANTVKQRLEP